VVVVQDLLSQEEIDALLHGVEDGDVSPANDTVHEGVRSYDLVSHDRIVRDKMPSLDAVNERFARYTKANLSKLLKQSADVSVGGVQIMTYEEYMHSLYTPTSLNIFKLRPLRGVALLTLDAKLVSQLVDSFFGGNGRMTRPEKRDFTATECRVVELLLGQAFIDLKEAWSGIYEVHPEHVATEINPSVTNIVRPSELILVSSFTVDIGEVSAGELQIALPYALIEPVRSQLEAGVQKDFVEPDKRWSNSFQSELLDADVSLDVTVLQSQLSLRIINSLKAGDIIPVDKPEHAVVKANAVPLYKATLGQKNGALAVVIQDKVTQPKFDGSHQVDENE